ncbi:asparaginase [Candidatus Aeolococcus gillhamiae]
MTRVVVFTTGGTIASRYDADVDGFVPVVSGDDLVAAVPGVQVAAEVEVVELANVSSTFLTPTLVFEWCRTVGKRLADPEVCGVVVTHGTDTLEESAYLFDLVLDTHKPIVFTGAMRTSSELISDGPRNILTSVRVAADPEAAGLGVLVVLNEEIHAARDVTKTHAEALDAFQSPNLGPLGRISRGWGEDHIRLYRAPRCREHITTDRIEPAVAYVKTVMGTDSLMIDAAVTAGARGMVIEAFGGGEVTPFMADGIDRARRAGVEVAVCSRALRGRPLDLYAEIGEGKWLRDHGVHFSDSLTGPKTRIKLMLALGAADPADVGQYF